MSESPTLSLDVIPLSTHIGAKIRGVDLTRALSTSEIAAIRQALLRWRVVFFREQFLTHDQHVAFTAQFGELAAAQAAQAGFDPIDADADLDPELDAIVLDRPATPADGGLVRRPWTLWQTDLTAAVNPPWGAVLRGVTVPPYGGDSQWTNLVRAYETLSAPIQRLVDGLRGIHRAPPSRGARAAEHPLVRAYTPKPASARESQALLELLWEHATRPEFTVRFKWEPRSIAFWDNRSTAHLAATDVFDLALDSQRYRTALAGDVPLGPDDRASVAIEGVPLSKAAALALS